MLSVPFCCTAPAKSLRVPAQLCAICIHLLRISVMPSIRCICNKLLCALQVAVSPCAKGTKSPTKKNKKPKHRKEHHGHGDDHHD